MILTTAILVLLLGCFINGKERGLVQILLSTTTYFCGWFLARFAAEPLGNALASVLPAIGNHGSAASSASLVTTSTNTFFYHGVAFMVIFWGTSFLGRWLMRSLRFIKKVPVVGTVNRYSGAVLSFLVGYVIIFMLLVVFQYLPGTWWQNQLAESGLAQLMIQKTPGSARAVFNWL